MHGQEVSLRIEVLNDIFQTHIAEFQNSVLNDPLLFIDGVEEVQKLHDVVLASEHVQDLKLSRNNVSCLLCSLKSNLALAVVVVGLEHVT